MGGLAMTDSLNTVTSDQKNALQLVEMVERLISYGGMYSDIALRLARDHLLSQTTKGANNNELTLIGSCVAFLALSEGD
jgi:hypothetical protein